MKEIEQPINEATIFRLAGIYKTLQQEMKDIDERLLQLKESIIEEMQYLDIMKLKNADHDVKYVIPKSFDLGLLRMDMPELAEKFTTKEIKTTESIKFDEKEFKRLYPEIYEQYRVEMTPRLTVK